MIFPKILADKHRWDLTDICQEEFSRPSSGINHGLLYQNILRRSPDSQIPYYPLSIWVFRSPHGTAAPGEEPRVPQGAPRRKRGSGPLQVSLGVPLEELLAPRGTEVVGLALVFCRELRGRLIDVHLAYQINCHVHQPPIASLSSPEVYMS